MVSTTAIPSGGRASAKSKSTKTTLKKGTKQNAAKSQRVLKKDATGNIVSQNTAAKKTRAKTVRPKVTPAEIKKRKEIELAELEKIREVEAKMAKSQVTDQLKRAFNTLAEEHFKKTGEVAPKYRISTPAALALHLLVIRLFRHKREEAAILCAAEQKKTLLRKHSKPPTVCTE